MKLAYDITLGRPACVLVAAGLGADVDASRVFPVKSWLLAPTPDMRVYETTADQLSLLVTRAREVYR